MSDPKKQNGSGMWMIAFLAAAMLFVAFRHAWSDIWIYQDGRQTPATISAEKSHGVFDYDYTASGVHYVGIGQRGRNLRPDTHVGQVALVWVSASHPQFSSPDMPIFSPWIALAIVLALIGLEMFAVISLVRMYRPAKKTLEPTAAAPGN